MSLFDPFCKTLVFSRKKLHVCIRNVFFQDPYPVFMHISDIDGEYCPRKGDRVRFHVCPMPPRFDKPQGVHITIIDYTPEVHKKWAEKETPEELAEDQIAIQEEKKLNELLKGRPGPLSPGLISPLRRQSVDPVPEVNGT